VLARVANASPAAVEETAPPSEPRGRGRPKLGVVAREVTLLPRHWEWLGRAAGRRLGRAAEARRRGKRVSGDKDRERQAAMRPITSCRPWRAISPQFEEASRALFADDRRRFTD
jgi:hypothetical protein